MQETEFRPLMDRENVVADCKRAYGAQLEMLRDLVNYGTNLIPRCFTTSDKELKDAVIIGVLLRQVVAMLDGIELLTFSGLTSTRVVRGFLVHAMDVRGRCRQESDVLLCTQPEKAKAVGATPCFRHSRSNCLRSGHAE